jgi:hypothetical protein
MYGSRVNAKSFAHCFVQSQLHDPLSLAGEGIGEALHVVLKAAMVRQELNVGTIDLDAARGLGLEVLLAAERGEAPVLGDDDLLATRELVLRSAESLQSDGAV